MFRHTNHLFFEDERLRINMIRETCASLLSSQRARLPYLDERGQDNGRLEESEALPRACSRPSAASGAERQGRTHRHGRQESERIA